MIITHEVINDTLCKLISYPNGDVFTKDGFEALANWSEQQEWWHEFVRQNGLGQDWRASFWGNPYCFALILFRFVVSSRV